MLRLWKQAQAKSEKDLLQNIRHYLEEVPSEDDCLKLTFVLREALRDIVDLGNLIRSREKKAEITEAALKRLQSVDQQPIPPDENDPSVNKEALEADAVRHVRVLGARRAT